MNNSEYKELKITHNKRARWLAWLWTLLVFILCFIPGKDLPEIHVPLIDKWAHVILFGVFSFLWHNTTPTGSSRYRLLLLLITVYVGWLVEYVQGHYVPNRSQDQMDTVADGIGGAIGIGMYAVYYRYMRKKDAN